MNKIALSLYSPSPYWDDVIFALRKEFDVDVYYEYHSDEEKGWKNLACAEGLYYSDMSFFTLLRKLSGYNYVILNGWRNYINILLAFFLGKKVCFMSDYPEEKNRTSFKEFVKKYLLHHTKALLAMSEATKKYYEDKYICCKNKTFVFPYTYSPIDNISELEDYNQTRRCKLIKQDANIKLFISTRFIERKGYGIVLQAFKELKKKDYLNKYDIVIAGNGPLYNQYRAEFTRLSMRIRFVGWIEMDDYKRFMSQCDVFLHPSLLEPFGIPPLDAMIRGKLYIGSDHVMSTATYIKNGDNGFQYPAQDSFALASILEEVLKNKHRIYEIGEKGKECVMRYYSETNICNGLRQALI